MRVDVYLTVQEASPEQLRGKNAVAIDVLRATSTIVTALANGASEVYPVLTPKEALELVLGWEPGSFLLGGERGSFPLPGFDLGNSPLEYQPELVEGKRLVFTTTNGTRAVRRCGEGHLGWAVSFLNLSAVAQAAAGGGRDLAIICAGTQEQFDLTDFACAGGLIDRLFSLLGAKLEASDLGLAARGAYSDSRRNIESLLRESRHGRRLVELGFSRDLAWCAQQDATPVVPHYDCELRMIRNDNI